MQNQNVSLSQSSIKAIVELCGIVERNNPNNERSVNMARGIADYVRAKGFLSPKQAGWVRQNAKFWNFEQPQELAAVPPSSAPIDPETTTGNCVQSLASLESRLVKVERLLGL